MAIDKTLIDQLLKDYKRPEEIIGENGLLKQLTKAVLERALEAEMSEHLGYEKHDPGGHHQGNPRNGKSRQKKASGNLAGLSPREQCCRLGCQSVDEVPAVGRADACHVVPPGTSCQGRIG